MYFISEVKTKSFRDKEKEAEWFTFINGKKKSLLTQRRILQTRMT